MKRDTLERITASLVIILITVFGIGFILMIANAIFGWDIFAPSVEKLLYFSGASILIIIFCSSTINIMLNISRLAFYAKHIATHFSKIDKE